MKQRFDFRLFADYFQFYLQDENTKGDLSESWSQEAVDRLLALAPGTIGVGTARNMTVPVVVEVADDAPDEDIGSWDQINECTIDVPSGRLLIAGCTDYFPDAARIQLSPGSYRARIYYGNLNVLNPNSLEGDDHYKIVLWSAPPGPIKVIKERPKPDIAAGS